MLARRDKTWTDLEHSDSSGHIVRLITFKVPSKIFDAQYWLDRAEEAKHQAGEKHQAGK